MISANIVRKYTKALSDISVENKKEKLYVQNLENVLEVFNNSEELRKCVYSFNVPKTIKINIMQDIFSNNVDPMIINFLILLIKNNKIDMLEAIYNDFKKVNYKVRNIIEITIISAAKLDDTIVSKIKDKYKLAYDASEVIATLLIDKNLIGGVKVIMNDEVADDSVKYKLTQLQKILGGL